MSFCSPAIGSNSASNAAAPAYLLPRPSGLYFRIRIPADLQPTLGRTEYRLSLGTSHLKEARPKAMRLASKAHDIFSEIRRLKTKSTTLENRYRKAMTEANETLQNHLTNEKIRELVDRKMSLKNT